MRRVGLGSIAVSLLLALAGCERWALDRQMEELCKKDGGITTFETVTLPSSEFDATGRVVTSRATKRSDGIVVAEVASLYQIEERTDVIKAGEPFVGIVSEGRLLRHQTTVRRMQDGKVLGEEIGYGRTGGEIAFGHPSQDYCPKPRPTPGVVAAVILKGP